MQNGVKLPIQCTNFLNVTEYTQLACFYKTTTAMDEDPNIWHIISTEGTNSLVYIEGSHITSLKLMKITAYNNAAFME